MKDIERAHVFDWLNEIVKNEDGWTMFYSSSEVKLLAEKALDILKKQAEGIAFINYAIDSTNGRTNYDIGMRNALRCALFTFTGEEPKYEDCEDKPVKPKYNTRTNWYECGACKHTITSGMHCKGMLIPAYKVKFCAECGKAVLWNA